MENRGMMSYFAQEAREIQSMTKAHEQFEKKEVSEKEANPLEVHNENKN